jgi:hypothetical protein
MEDSASNQLLISFPDAALPQGTAYSTAIETGQKQDHYNMELKHRREKDKDLGIELLS